MSEQKKSSTVTPKGTPPQPVRRSTKHRRPEYGRELIAKAAARVRSADWHDRNDA